MTRLIIVVAAVMVAAAIAAFVNRRSGRSNAPTRTGGLVPEQIDRADLAPSDSPWLLVVFTSRTCIACAEVIARARTVTGPAVDVHELEFVRDRSIHEKYSIESVPMTLLIDTDGATVHSWVGPLNLDELEAALDRGVDPADAG